MKEKARRFVGIVAMVCLSILFGVRKDYPVACILFIVAISETVGWCDRSAKRGSFRYTFKSEGVESVRDAFTSIGDTARESTPSIFDRIEAELKTVPSGEMGVLLISAREFEELRVNSQYLKNVVYETSTSPALTSVYRGRIGNLVIFSLLPANPQAPSSPSE